MDRTLDEIISERPRGRPKPEQRRPPPPPAPRAPRGPRRDEGPRDGVRKNRPDERVNIDSDWVHDRYEEERYGGERSRQPRRPPMEHDRFDDRGARPEENGTRIKVDNIHYELTENDLRELFERVGPIISVRLLYDRMDRSQGTAFVTYDDPRDARTAIAQFDNCNANGQPIRLTMMPTAPAARPKDTLFDRIEHPGRSLFDRIEGGAEEREVVGGRRRNRSESPRRRPTPENIDRYVPGRRGGSRSPIRRRGTPRDPGRRPGQRREDSSRATRGGRRPKTDEAGRPLVGGRPKKTAADLDMEMEDYWGSKASNGDSAAPAQNGTSINEAPKQAADDDIDMIE